MFDLKTLTLSGALAASILGASQAEAAVYISLDQVEVFAGQNARVGVYLRSDNNEIITGFNLPLDLNKDGYVDSAQDGDVGDLPAGFSYAIAPVENAVYNNTELDADAPALLDLYQVDSIATGSGSDLQLSATPVKLFDLSINVADDVVTGTVLPIQFLVPEAVPEALEIAGRPNPVVAEPSAGMPVQGSITVVAIPEPATLGLLTSATLLLRRKTKR